jgi:hypothetical protein
LYEFLSLTGLHGVFDFYDIIAILIGAGCLYLFHYLYKIGYKCKLRVKN